MLRTPKSQCLEWALEVWEMTHIGIKEMFLLFLWKFKQYLASYGKPGCVHAWGIGTEGEKGDVHIGSERQKQTVGEEQLGQSAAKGQHETTRSTGEELWLRRRRQSLAIIFTSMFWNSTWFLLFFCQHIRCETPWLSAHPTCPSDHLCWLLHHLKQKMFYGSATVILVPHSRTFCL